MAVTTVTCDKGLHLDCPGEGLAYGNHIVHGRVWVTIDCGCPCHNEQKPNIDTKPNKDNV
jgi:hypothetical protein